MKAERLPNLFPSRNDFQRFHSAAEKRISKRERERETERRRKGVGERKREENPGERALLSSSSSLLLWVPNPTLLDSHPPFVQLPLLPTIAPLLSPLLSFHFSHSKKSQGGTSPAETTTISHPIPSLPSLPPYPIDTVS
jgi:hypothetical protein